MHLWLLVGHLLRGTGHDDDVWQVNADLTADLLLDVAQLLHELFQAANELGADAVVGTALATHGVEQWQDAVLQQRRVHLPQDLLQRSDHRGPREGGVLERLLQKIALLCVT